MELTGKTALVTGGTRGIGRAIVERFAQAGANIAFTFISSAAAAEEVAANVRSSGVEVLAIQADGASFEAADQVVAQVMDTWGHLDVLVNNAGITRDNLLIRMNEADWDSVIDTNLKSVFNFCKAAYRPMMKQRSGKVVNLSSVVGSSGNPGQANYAASKAGIIGFSKSLARELAGRGVSVNVLSPGYVDTEMTSAMPESARQAMLDAVPMGRAARPDEIAETALFLASNASDYITGHVLHVNGGLYM
ncbi:MAG: 3-oxoacyl-[acyl-carrier-protein] reductase [Rhodothermales bacterium]